MIREAIRETIKERYKDKWGRDHSAVEDWSWDTKAQDILDAIPSIDENKKFGGYHILTYILANVEPNEITNEILDLADNYWDINKISVFGSGNIDALHMAVKLGYFEIATYLINNLKAKIRPKMKDIYGKDTNLLHYFLQQANSKTGPKMLDLLSKKIKWDDDLWKTYCHYFSSANQADNVINIGAAMIKYTVDKESTIEVLSDYKSEFKKKAALNKVIKLLKD